MSYAFIFTPNTRGVGVLPTGWVGPIAIAASLILNSAPVVSVLAEEKPADSARNPSPKVTKISGVIESVTAVEVSVDHEHVSALEIKRLLPHGTEVAKGQNIVWFDTEDFDEKISQAEIVLKLAELNLAEEEFKFDQFLKIQALDKAAAQRSRKQAQQKFDNYMGVDREREVRVAEFSLKSSKSSLANATEELNQLEQMYKEDDLTEESEEIVLKRAKQAVESAEFRLRGTEISTKRTIEQVIPRKDASEEEALERAQLAFVKSIKDLANSRVRREIELSQERDKFDELREKVEEMRAERKQMVLQTPSAGVLLHGKLTRGKLSDKPSALKVGSKVTADQVIATIVHPSKLQVRVDLAETHLGLVNPGTKCTVVPKPFPEMKLTGTVKSVSSVPYAGTKYDCVVAFRVRKDQAVLAPLMGCDLEFAVEEDKTEDEESDDDKSNKETVKTNKAEEAESDKNARQRSRKKNKN